MGETVPLIFNLDPSAQVNICTGEKKKKIESPVIVTVLGKNTVDPL